MHWVNTGLQSALLKDLLYIATTGYSIEENSIQKNNSGDKAPSHVFSLQLILNPHLFNLEYQWKICMWVTQKS